MVQTNLAGQSQLNFAICNMHYAAKSQLNSWFLKLHILFWVAYSFVIHHAGTQLLRTTLGVKEYLQREFLKVQEEILVPNKQLFPSPITLDDFFWAFGILRSRTFSRLRGQNLVLIPLADLVRSPFSFFKPIFGSRLKYIILMYVIALHCCFPLLVLLDITMKSSGHGLEQFSSAHIC